MTTRICRAAAAGFMMLAGCQSPAFLSDSAQQRTQMAAVQGRASSGESSAVARRPPGVAPALAESASRPEERPRPAPSQAPPKSAAENLRLGHAAEAQARLEQARGRAEQARRLMEEAQAHYRQALAEQADHPDAHHRLGVIADQQQRYDTAEWHYLTALRGKPRDADLISDLGYSYYLQGRTRESERYFLQALALHPTHARALNNLGFLYARTGDYHQALETFRRAGSEEEAQARMAELFPNGTPSQMAQRSAGGMNMAAAARTAAPSEDRGTPRGVNESPRIGSAWDLERAASQRDAASPPDYGRVQAAGRLDETGVAPSPGITRPAGPSPSGHWPQAPADAAPQPAATLRQYADHVPAARDSAYAGGATFPAGQPAWGSESRSDQSAVPPWPHGPLGEGATSPHRQAQRAEPASHAASSSSQGPPTADDVRRTAQVLGMNAGPGGMFPVVPAHAQESRPERLEHAAPDNAAANAGGAWGDADPLAAYQEQIRRHEEEINELRRMLEAERRHPPSANLSLPQGYNTPPPWPHQAPMPHDPSFSAPQPAAQPGSW